jgi:putative DNA primase/helicase
MKLALALKLPPNLEKTPQELKDRRQWVVWKSVRDEDGKFIKVPYQPFSPQRQAQSNNRVTWSTFDQAVQVAGTEGFNGVGYVFSEDDPYTGIDLDNCRDSESEKIEEWALKIIRWLGSYTEISPSGYWVHILVRGKLPPGGNRKDKVEMYDCRRYFTMSGHHLEETPTAIEDRQAELEALHKEIFSQEKKEPPRAVGSCATLGLSDHDLIDKMREADDGGKFEKL